MYSCKTWRHLLIGTEVVVHTDHNPLLHLYTQADLSKRQMRWLGFLSEYDLAIRYVEGTKNVVADAFSRDPNYRRLTKDLDSLSKQFMAETCELKDESMLFTAAFYSLSDKDLCAEDVTPFLGEDKERRQRVLDIIEKSYASDPLYLRLNLAPQLTLSKR